MAQAKSKYKNLSQWETTQKQLILDLGKMQKAKEILLTYSVYVLIQKIYSHLLKYILSESRLLARNRFVCNTITSTNFRWKLPIDQGHMSL